MISPRFLDSTILLTANQFSSSNGVTVAALLPGVIFVRVGNFSFGQL